LSNGEVEEGPEYVPALWKRIFGEWFPTSGYTHTENPEVEAYYRRPDGREYCEVWIPVTKKE
jgi:AraC family transcriptional regulator